MVFVIENYSSFDMCCSVHFCDNNFYNQQMHTLYFVGQTYKVPYKIKCVHLLLIKVIIRFIVLSVRWEVKF